MERRIQLEHAFLRSQTCQSRQELQIAITLSDTE